MKKFILLMAIILGGKVVFGQIISSSCSAHDSIVAKYQDDADRLALRKIYLQNLLIRIV